MTLKKGKELVKALEDLGNSLEKVMANEDGGKVILKSPEGKNIVFAIPPKSKRKHLCP